MTHQGPSGPIYCIVNCASNCAAPLCCIAVPSGNIPAIRKMARQSMAL